MSEQPEDRMGPKVVNVRYGSPGPRPLIAVTFNERLNAPSARNRANYALDAFGPDGQPGTADDLLIPLASASYRKNGRVVNLRPARRLRRREPYLLTVLGGANGVVSPMHRHLQGGPFEAFILPARSVPRGPLGLARG